MEEIELIPMEQDMKWALENRYRQPFRRNVAVLTVVFLLLYFLILAGSNSQVQDGVMRFSQRKGGYELIKACSFDIVLTGIFLLFYTSLYKKFARQNICYLRDAAFGFVLKERMTISKVFPTPAGIAIYWLDHPAIKTFTPDPYRHFREGDTVVIYYLKHSGEYLAYA